MLVRFKNLCPLLTPSFMPTSRRVSSCDATWWYFQRYLFLIFLLLLLDNEKSNCYALFKGTIWRNTHTYFGYHNLRILLEMDYYEFWMTSWGGRTEALLLHQHWRWWVQTTRQQHSRTMLKRLTIISLIFDSFTLQIDRSLSLFF